MSEEPPQFTPDESQRIEDPEKAHAMAFAESLYRDRASENALIAERLTMESERDDIDESDREDLLARAESHAQDAKYILRDADRVGDAAGEEYDAEQSRVQDPEKARVMAEAGDADRTTAARARKEAQEGNITYQGPVSNKEWARVNDNQANYYEESAGRAYEFDKKYGENDTEITEDTERQQQYSAEDEPGPDANRKVEVDFKRDDIEKNEVAETDGLTQEDQVKILEHMTEVLRTHSISEAFKQAHLAEGNVSTAEGLLALGIKAHKEAQEFDRLRFSKPEEALPHLDEARACVKILAEITSGKASDPNYQINS